MEAGLVSMDTFWVHFFEFISRELQLARDGQGKLDQVLDRLELLQVQGEQIMADIDKANELLGKINSATTQQGENLQKISDNLDALIARAGTSVPSDVLAGLQTQADHLSAQADFSKALASKGVDNPVPIPVPVPPEPTP